MNNLQQLKDILEILAYSIGIIVPIIGGTIFLIRKRIKDIKLLTKYLSRSQSNEGNINSNELFYLHLDLNLFDGDLFGSLTCTNRDKPFEAHVKVKWFSVQITISELLGRGIREIANVSVRLKGNKNRLYWRLIGKKGKEYLPYKTMLWPSNDK